MAGLAGLLVNRYISLLRIIKTENTKIENSRNEDHWPPDINTPTQQIKSGKILENIEQHKILLVNICKTQYNIQKANSELYDFEWNIKIQN